MKNKTRKKKKKTGIGQEAEKDVNDLHGDEQMKIMPIRYYWFCSNDHRQDMRNFKMKLK